MDLSETQQQECRDGADAKVQKLIRGGEYVLTFWDGPDSLHQSGYSYLPMALALKGADTFDYSLHLGD
jgi:hypothetical protein